MSTSPYNGTEPHDFNLLVERVADRVYGELTAYGVPDEKMPRDVVDHAIDFLKGLGDFPSVERVASRYLGERK